MNHGRIEEIRDLNSKKTAGHINSATRHVGELLEMIEEKDAALRGTVTHLEAAGQWAVADLVMRAIGFTREEYNARFRS